MIKKNLRTHILLFLFTFLTLTFKGDLFIGIFQFEWRQMLEIFRIEWSYSLSLITILLCHEMGHYLPARYYGVKATLPYFIPFPLGPIGTMGAVIQIKEPIPDKIKLFDIGVGGPVMSLVLSVPSWLLGLSLSELVPITVSSDQHEFLIFGDSLFTYWTSQWIFGAHDPNLFMIESHPLARAGWVGLIITAINLLPFGQLDGGHIIYSMFGEKYRKWIYYLFLSFLILSFFNFTWLVWGFLIYFFIKIEHPFVPDHSFQRLGKKRIFLGSFMLISFIFIFVPAPLSIGSELDAPNLLEYFFGW
ncbi:site-2 protease family protein [Leptospira sp. GIMC2001]|uniref:site-2 protease family protein n=1 Tax=Leptospira sp. GIMC2001 TaxID=1513297 RepID=UPI00234A2B12|nr:site-2 protease family protein [Leptospira sp. GIMC2001]WCL49442.1 site-2 protease family protein [Leptospira sp. GIMC2001]